ncbi:MAG TPA: MiaB/RimO family radical SAM methylthiotransferase [Polyangiaceae bacterium]|nr:MiaB/RimO family radical SAM methylthiotransferase [Polyangiaceae bacterium]
MPRFHVITFGCQMNSHDSARMAETLSQAGYEEASGLDSADVVVLNTCSVREKAEQKLRSEVGRLALRKAERPGMILAVAGCVAQQEGEKLLRQMPDVDVVVGPDNIAELPLLVADAEAGVPPQVRTVFDLDAPRFLQAAPRPGRVEPTAYVTIMKGCNERCSFCIVPTTRGPERYRPSAEIVEEIARLVDAGVREVTLLGQTVNSYTDPSRALPPAPLAGEGVKRWGARARGDETEFPALLRAIAERVPGLLRLRYTSPHPRHLTPALVQTHRDLPVLARHVHLPVQSGSDRMLKRMIRRYDVAEYHERVGLLREEVPGVTLSTDVIVGFSGEGRGDFESTLELLARVRFSGVFAFKYSVRPKTPAEHLPDDVPEAEKEARLAAVLELTERIRREHLGSLVGSRAEVLVEGPGKTGGYTGRTERNEIVHFASAEDPTGTVLPVEITRAFKNSLEGRLPEGLRVPTRERASSPERRSLPVI